MINWPPMEYGSLFIYHLPTTQSHIVGFETPGCYWVDKAAEFPTGLIIIHHNNNVIIKVFHRISPGHLLHWLCWRPAGECNNEQSGNVREIGPGPPPAVAGLQQATIPSSAGHSPPPLLCWPPQPGACSLQQGCKHKTEVYKL